MTIVCKIFILLFSENWNLLKIKKLVKNEIINVINPNKLISKKKLKHIKLISVILLMFNKLFLVNFSNLFIKNGERRRWALLSAI